MTESEESGKRFTLEELIDQSDLTIPGNGSLTVFYDLAFTKS